MALDLAKRTMSNQCTDFAKDVHKLQLAELRSSCNQALLQQEEEFHRYRSLVDDIILEKDAEIQLLRQQVSVMHHDEVTRCVTTKTSENVTSTSAEEWSTQRTNFACGPEIEGYCHIPRDECSQVIALVRLLRDQQTQILAQQQIIDELTRKLRASAASFTDRIAEVAKLRAALEAAALELEAAGAAHSVEKARIVAASNRALRAFKNDCVTQLRAAACGGDAASTSAAEAESHLAPLAEAAYQKLLEVSEARVARLARSRPLIGSMAQHA